MEERTEEANKNCCRKSNPNSSSLKRAARDPSRSPTYGERDNLASSVLLQSFASKRTRICSDFQSSHCSTGLNKVHLKSGENHEDDANISRKSEASQRNVEHSRSRGNSCELGETVETDAFEMNNKRNVETPAENKDTPSKKFVLEEVGDEGENDDGSQENGGDENSDCDNVSEISGLSDLSMESRWNSSAGMMVWVHQQISRGTNPRDVLRHFILDETEIPEDFDNQTLWQLILSIVSEPPKRRKLAHVNTLEQVVNLIRTSKKIIVLTGAGISVSCGIPDFRSYNGIYARLAVDYPDLPNPNAMFEIKYFRKNPKPFFKFAREIYPGLFVPSVSHRFIGHLESQNQLLRNYTQNIDTLELAAGITRVVQCHGSFAGATCLVCKYHVDAEFIRDDIMNQVIPRCPQCSPEEELAILKPDIVFFGESLSEAFHHQIETDKEECDLLIVIGSSLKVRPVSMIPSMIPAHVPQVLVNREPLPSHNFDVELLGNSDIIIDQLCHLLGDSFESLCTTKEVATQLTRDDLPTSAACHNSTAGTSETTRPPAFGNPEQPQPVVADIRSGNMETTSEKSGEVVQMEATEVSKRSEVDIGGSKDPQQLQPVKISSQLTENTYVYLPPRRYVFVGGEVYEDDEEMASDSSSSSSCSSEAEEADDSVQMQAVDEDDAENDQNTKADNDIPLNQPLERLDTPDTEEGCGTDGVLAHAKTSSDVEKDPSL